MREVIDGGAFEPPATRPSSKSDLGGDYAAVRATRKSR